MEAEATAQNLWSYENLGLATTLGTNGKKQEATSSETGPPASRVRTPDLLASSHRTLFSPGAGDLNEFCASRESCKSVIEYLSTSKQPQSGHRFFSGSRLGTSGETVLKPRRQAKEGEVTQSSIMYRTTMEDIGSHAKKKRQMTAEEAEEFLRHSNRSPLKPPKTVWESDDMRQQVIESFAKEIPDEDAPGGSWVVRAGALPASRALNKNPDKIAPVAAVNKERRRMLGNLRFQMSVAKIYSHMDLLPVFRQHDSDTSNHIQLPLFLEILKSFGFELTASRLIDLEEMFISKRRPGYVDYQYFVDTLMEHTEDSIPQNQNGEEAPILKPKLKNVSSIFNGCDSLRPKSRSGRFHTFNDMKFSMERPLVIAPGNQAIRGMYQFMTDREMLMAHRLRDRDPPIDPIKANNSSLDSKSADFSGRSLHKLESTPKVDAQARDPEKSMVAVVDEDVHAVNSNWSSSSRNSKSPSKARGRSVEFRTADPNPEEELLIDALMRGRNARLAPLTPKPKNDASMPAEELRSPNNVEDGLFAGFRGHQNTLQLSPSSSPQAASPMFYNQNSMPSPGNLVADSEEKETVPMVSPGQKYRARYFDQPKIEVPRMPRSRKIKNDSSIKPLEPLRPPAWDVAHRYQVRPADMNTKLSHADEDGANLTCCWQASNDCNKDIPGGVAARQSLKKQLEQNQKVNASKRQTNWSYAHGGFEWNPTDWSSTMQDQMLFKSRERTPKKHPTEVQELREPPWSVAERHQVHLGKYDHRLVGLRRPEPLAKGAP